MHTNDPSAVQCSSRFWNKCKWICTCDKTHWSHQRYAEAFDTLHCILIENDSAKERFHSLRHLHGIDRQYLECELTDIMARLIDISNDLNALAIEHGFSALDHATSLVDGAYYAVKNLEVD